MRSDISQMLSQTIKNLDKDLLEWEASIRNQMDKLEKTRKTLLELGTKMLEESNSNMTIAMHATNSLDHEKWRSSFETLKRETIHGIAVMINNEINKQQEEDSNRAIAHIEAILARVIFSESILARDSESVIASLDRSTPKWDLYSPQKEKIRSTLISMIDDEGRNLVEEIRYADPSGIFVFDDEGVPFDNKRHKARPYCKTTKKIALVIFPACIIVPRGVVKNAYISEVAEVLTV